MTPVRHKSIGLGIQVQLFVSQNGCCVDVSEDMEHSIIVKMNRILRDLRQKNIHVTIHVSREFGGFLNETKYETSCFCEEITFIETRR